LIVPTTAPEAAPPTKLAFDRLTPVTVCAWVTAIARVADVLAAHAGAETAAKNEATNVPKIRNISILTLSQ
jgi:hypothetical protein